MQALTQMLSCERISDRCTELLDVPVLNVLCTNSLVSWLNMRIVLMDTGRKFSIRIEVISSVFLAISLLSGIFLALKFLGLLSV